MTDTSQQATIRDLERSVRALSDQVKYLTINNSPPASIHHMQQPQQAQNSPAGPPQQPMQSNVGSSHLRQPIPPANPAPAPYSQPLPQFQQQQPFQQPQPQPQPAMQQHWYNGIPAPQASHPATIPQLPPAPPPQSERSATPPAKSDQWDEKYLSVLHSQDAGRLRDLLSITNPDLVLPINGTPPLVSQAVILTLIHRVNQQSFIKSCSFLTRYL